MDRKNRALSEAKNFRTKKELSQSKSQSPVILSKTEKKRKAKGSNTLKSNENTFLKGKSKLSINKSQDSKNESKKFKMIKK